MRVRMITTAAGPNGNKQANRCYEVSAAEGRQLIQGGYAKPEGVQPVERAERAVNPRANKEHRGANTPGSGDGGDDAEASAAASVPAAGAGSTSGQASAPAAGQGRKTSASAPKSAAAVTSNGGGKHSGKGRGKGK